MTHMGFMTPRIWITTYLVEYYGEWLSIDDLLLDKLYQFERFMMSINYSGKKVDNKPLLIDSVNSLTSKNDMSWGEVMMTTAWWHICETWPERANLSSKQIRLPDCTEELAQRFSSPWISYSDETDFNSECPSTAAHTITSGFRLLPGMIFYFLLYYIYIYNVCNIYII